MADENTSDYIHRKVAVRELISWLLGAMVGVYLGVRIGLLVGSNLAPLLGAVTGWCLCGYTCWRVSKALFRSKPKLTISARSVKDACFGLAIGSMAGGFMSEIAQINRLAGIIAGVIAGLVVGAVIGESSARSKLKKEAETSG